MPFQDMLLHIDSYPEATPEEAIEQAIGFAQGVKGKLAALSLEVDIPLQSNRLADYLVGLSGLVESEEQKSACAAASALAHFTKSARKAGVFAGAICQKADLYETSRAVARRAITRDLCLLAQGGQVLHRAELAKTVIFDSGRPAILYRPGAADLPVGSLGAVMLAWDGSPTAAEAMREALPLLQVAPEVRVVTFVDEKPSATAGLGTEAVRHLRAYGVKAVAEDVASEGGAIGDCLDRYVVANKPSLLVMGAYGHSRIREFILGGATEHVLHAPKVAVFLAR